jgi:hypothetical protein
MSTDSIGKMELIGVRRSGCGVGAMSGPATIAVVGGGASGCLTAMQVARATAGRLIEIVIIEPVELGAGLGFSTPRSTASAQCAARAMSALPEESEHFLELAAPACRCRVPGRRFRPALVLRRVPPAGAGRCRRCCGHGIAGAAASSGHRPPSAWPAAAPDPERWRQPGSGCGGVGDGPQRAGHVLGTGGAAPVGRFVADPWRTDRESRLPAGSDVLLVGAGLTMADMARRWAVDGVRLHVVSRHGALPLPSRSRRRRECACHASSGAVKYIEGVQDGPLVDLEIYDGPSLPGQVPLVRAG